MATYSVNTELFQGPFDLLLHLVSKQKLDINALSLTEIADQYLDHIEKMRDLDLDVASEFLVLAATLLEIKAASLLPKEEVYLGDELDDLSPTEMRDLLVARLVHYKQFKNVAAELSLRMENEGKQHPRQAGLEKEYLNLMPDYLEGVTLHSLAVICADLAFRREVFLLEAEHIASMPVSLETHAESIRKALHGRKRVSFSELFPEDAAPEIVVVTFLAILELYKRGIIDLLQSTFTEDIEVVELDEQEAQRRGIVTEEYDDYN